MIKTGKCPGCKATISNARVESIEITRDFKPLWKGASFSCPSCSCVLGVGLDPIALQTDIVNEVVERLRKGA